MRQDLMRFLVGVLSVGLSVTVFAEELKVLDVYTVPLPTYTKEGKKLQLKITHKEEIIDTVIQEKTPRNLVKIKFGKGDVWVRASHLKLSLPVLARCPDSAPGRATDRTTPVSSGMGAKCKEQDK